MAERLSQQPERKLDHEELAKERHKHQERLREDIERRAERDGSKERLEDVRQEVEKAAAEREKSRQEKQAASPAERRKEKPIRNRKTLDASFNTRMKEVRQDMSAPKRAFSKFIHNKTVEKTSETVGSTIARPNAILSGAVAAFLLTAGLYFWARHVGYPLSGFETIGAFIIGWLIGIIFDFTKIMMTGKR